MQKIKKIVRAEKLVTTTNYQQTTGVILQDPFRPKVGDPKINTKALT